MRPTPVENIYKGCTRISQVIKAFIPICCYITEEFCSFFNGEDHEQDPDVRGRYAHNHKQDHVRGQVRGHEQCHVHKQVRVRMQGHVREIRVRHGRREIQTYMLDREHGQRLEQHEQRERQLEQRKLRVQREQHELRVQLEQQVQRMD